MITAFVHKKKNTPDLDVRFKRASVSIVLFRKVAIDRSLQKIFVAGIRDPAIINRICR